MAIAKRQVKIQRRNRVADGNGLRRASTPKPGDTFIVTERLVVDCILDGLVWVRRIRYDGTDEHFCIRLDQWRRKLRATMRNGATFRPV